MKRNLILALAAATALMFDRNCEAQTPILTDIGPNPPATGPNDVYMTDESAVGQPPGLNYYSNGSGPGGNPGQIFTTGSNPNGRATIVLPRPSSIISRRGACR